MHRASGRRSPGRGRVRIRPRVRSRRARRRPHDGRAERGRQGRDQPPRPSGPGAAGMATVPHQARPDVKVRTAALSVVSNSALILLKVIAGTVTGSVAILTEAVHSSIDLIASIVAFISVRKAGEPADEDHRYGHEKLENLAAGIEGILILVGAAVIAFEAIRRLILSGHLQNVGLRIAVVAISVIVNIVVSTVIARTAVLIHLEPEDRVRPGEELRPSRRGRAGAKRLRSD